MAIPHNSKCRYGERGAAAAKPKAQIILCAAKVSAASGGCSEPKQGQRSQSARGFCPEARCGYRNPTLSSILATRMPCRSRRNGLDKSGGTMDELDDAEYSGSVLSLIENGEAFIKRNARMMWRKTLNLREKLPEYVERSCHEAQINYRQRNRLSGSFVIDAHRERYRKTPTPPTGFSCPLGVFTQVVLGVVFRQSTTASKPLKRRPAIIGRACAGLNCRVNARKSPTL